jgi:hypothetical protein
MAKGPEEWFQQAQYDLRTAEAMFEAKKYIYVEKRLSKTKDRTPAGQE